MEYSDDEDIDFFDARIQFSDLLAKLTSSQQSVTNAAMFAVKYKKFSGLFYEVLTAELKKQVSIMILLFAIFFSFLIRFW